jgi:hypothetical protein
VEKPCGKGKAKMVAALLNQRGCASYNHCFLAVDFWLVWAETAKKGSDLLWTIKIADWQGLVGQNYHSIWKANNITIDIFKNHGLGNN